MRKVIPVLKETVDRKVQMDMLELRGHEEVKVQMDMLELKGHEEVKVQMDMLELKGHEEVKVELARQVRQGQQVRLDHKDRTVQWVELGLQALQGQLVQQAQLVRAEV